MKMAKHKTRRVIAKTSKLKEEKWKLSEWMKERMKLENLFIVLNNICIKFMLKHRRLDLLILMVQWLTLELPTLSLNGL
jgi:hypothetical protein